MASRGSTFIAIMATRIVCLQVILASTVSPQSILLPVYQTLTYETELDLPEYETYEDLRKQLHTAMTAGGEYFGFA